MTQVPHRDAQWVRAAYESFVSSAGSQEPNGIDPVVAASWRRCLRNGVDPDRPRTVAVAASGDLDDYRRAHPLAAAMPLVRDLVGGATSDGLVVAVSDDVGRLLWIEGRGPVRSAVDHVGFVEGAVWREESVGTNAPGTALTTRRPVQVLGAEHFARPVQRLSCTAAPVRDPAGGIVGVLDLTGGSAAGSHVALALVRATVAMVERELAARADGVAERAPDLRLLGPPALRGHRLSLRHAEILLLLAEHPRGLGAEELAVLLHPGDLSLVAVRAEISRLRRVADGVLDGPLLAGSRPYRLARALRSDVDTVRSRLRRGDVRGALSAYPEALLRRSVAPGVERLREELEAEVRGAVHACDDAAAVEHWTARDEGADDHAAWTRLARLAQPGGPQAARAWAHLGVLERRLS
ncbi:GAF domain-containing protein [Promicromonospora soli]|uniref:Transcriptional regulator n=1 Tax=Promicromonospora soli TaxID=2035533 RepID=A0A919FW39_9MICO|nr:GAF domain-containing protein [Promicromonospora soli]GHH73416.1 putative transcriptional regulator [Promicromonospora soli]